MDASELLQRQQQQHSPLINVAELANLRFGSDEQQAGERANAPPESQPPSKDAEGDEETKEEVFEPFNFGINPHLIDLYNLPEQYPIYGDADEDCPLRINERALMEHSLGISFSAQNNEGDDTAEEEPLAKIKKQCDETVTKYLSLFNADASTLGMDRIHSLLEYHSVGKIGDVPAFQEEDDPEPRDERITKLYFMAHSAFRKLEVYAGAAGVFGRLLHSAQENGAARKNFIDELSSFTPNLHATIEAKPAGYEHARLAFPSQKVSVHITSTVSPAAHNITIPAKASQCKNDDGNVASGQGGEERAKKGGLKRPRAEEDEKTNDVLPRFVTAIGKKQVDLLWLSCMGSTLSSRVFVQAAKHAQSNSAGAVGKNYMRFETPEKVAVTSYSTPDAAFTVERVRSGHSYKKNAMAALLSDGQGPHSKRGVDTDFLLTAIAEEQLLRLSQTKTGVLTGADEGPSVLGALSAVVTHKSAVRRLRKFFDGALAGPECKRLMVRWGRTVTSPCPATELVLTTSLPTHMFVQAIIAGADYVRCTPMFKPEVENMMRERGTRKKIVPEHLEYNLDEFIKTSTSIFSLFHYE